MLWYLLAFWLGGSVYGFVASTMAEVEKRPSLWAVFVVVLFWPVFQAADLGRRLLKKGDG